MKFTITKTEETKGVYTSYNFAYDFSIDHKHIDIIKSWNIGSEIHHTGVSKNGVTIGCNVFHESSNEPFLCNIN